MRIPFFLILQKNILKSTGEIVKEYYAQVDEYGMQDKDLI